MQPARVVDPYRLFDGLSRLLLRLEVRVEEILVLEDPVRFYGSQLSRTRFVRIKWCAWWDSNPHALRQRNLNPSCIPISPQAHAESLLKLFLVREEDLGLLREGLRFRERATGNQLLKFLKGRLLLAV